MTDEQIAELILRYGKHRASFTEDEVEALLRLQRGIEMDAIIMELALEGHVTLGMASDGTSVMVALARPATAC